MCDGTGKCLTRSGDNCNEYEKLFNYEYNCESIKCPNYNVCFNKFPKWLGDCHQNRCVNCDIIFGNTNLIFLNFGNTEFSRCEICYESYAEQVRFPQCMHHVCVECFGEIYFYDEQKYHLNPMLYGCPQCPNGCINPRKGKQCYCIEYDAIKDKWSEDYPLLSAEWNDDENESIENHDNIVYGSKTCPFCRAGPLKQNWNKN